MGICKRTEKFYVVDGLERVCGLRWDALTMEVMTCGFSDHEETMNDVLDCFDFEVGKQVTRPTPNKCRVMVWLKHKEDWSKGLQRVVKKYDLELTGTFRRLCR